MNLVESLKAFVRRTLDSFYCRPAVDKQRIGTIDSWHVLTGNLKNAVIYSGGVGKDITFEIALAREFGSQIFLFDPSPTGIATVESLQLPLNVRFFPLGLASKDGDLSFATPLKPLEGSFRLGTEGTVKFECKKISTLLKENGHTSIELLKIDIEGFEYEVIEDIVASGVDVRQIAVEFHDFYPDISRARTARSIHLLRRHGYRIFHKRGHDYSFAKHI